MPAGRRDEPAEDADERALARAVRPEQPVDGARRRRAGTRRRGRRSRRRGGSRPRPRWPTALTGASAAGAPSPPCLRAGTRCPSVTPSRTRNTWLARSSDGLHVARRVLADVVHVLHGRVEGVARERVDGEGHGVADVDQPELGLRDVGADEELVVLDERRRRLAGREQVAGPEVERLDDAVARGDDGGLGEVGLGEREPRLRLRRAGRGPRARPRRGSRAWCSRAGRAPPRGAPARRRRPPAASRRRATASAILRRVPVGERGLALRAAALSTSAWEMAPVLSSSAVRRGRELGALELALGRGELRRARARRPRAVRRARAPRAAPRRPSPARGRPSTSAVRGPFTTRSSCAWASSIAARASSRLASSSARSRSRAPAPRDALALAHAHLDDAPARARRDLDRAHLDHAADLQRLVRDPGVVPLVRAEAGQEEQGHQRSPAARLLRARSSAPPRLSAPAAPRASRARAPTLQPLRPQLLEELRRARPPRSRRRARGAPQGLTLRRGEALGQLVLDPTASAGTPPTAAGRAGSARADDAPVRRSRSRSRAPPLEPVHHAHRRAPPEPARSASPSTVSSSLRARRGAPRLRRREPEGRRQRLRAPPRRRAPRNARSHTIEPRSLAIRSRIGHRIDSVTNHCQRHRHPSNKTPRPSSSARRLGMPFRPKSLGVGPAERGRGHGPPQGRSRKPLDFANPFGLTLSAVVGRGVTGPGPAGHDVAPPTQRPRARSAVTPQTTP